MKHKKQIAYCDTVPDHHGIFRGTSQKMLAFSRESDRINVKMFLRCGQMFAEKRRVFCLNGHGTGT